MHLKHLNVVLLQLLYLSHKITNHFIEWMTLLHYSTKVVIYIAIQNKTQNANLKFYEMIRVDLYSTTRI